MSNFIAIIFFLIFNVTLVFLLNKSFKQTIILSFLIPTFILYLSGLVFNSFIIGYIINLLILLAGIVLIIKNIKNKQKINKFLKQYFDSGFYCFITICLLVLIFDGGRNFTSWDEFSHWGVMVRQMLKLNTFYSVPESTLMVVKDYPPMLQLFETLWCKLSLGYSESSVMIALRVFSFSLLIPALCCKSKNIIKLIVKTILSCVLLYLTILLFDNHGVINSIYIDYPLAIMVGFALFYGLILFNPKSKFDILFLSLFLTFLLLTKQIAIALYLMILFLLFLSILYKVLVRKKIKIDKKNIIILILSLIIFPLLFNKTWSIYINNLGITNNFDISKININEIVNGDINNNYRIDVVEKYKNALGEDTIVTFGNISYVQCGFIAIFIILLLYINNKKKFDVCTALMLTLTTIIGFLGYALLILILYLFCFSEYEALNLASFNRYMPTYVILIISAVIMIYISINQETKENFRKLIIIILFLLFIQTDASLNKMRITIFNKHDENSYERHANIIKSKVPSRSKVFLLSDSNYGNYNYFIKYYMDDIYMSSKCIFNNYNIGHQCNMKELEQEMRKYDYVYVINFGDKFKQEYGDLFESEIFNDEIYVVSNEKNEVKLKIYESK